MSQPATCALCGHDSDAHRLHGYFGDDGSSPVEGWMDCPVVGCDCVSTWARLGGSVAGAEAAYRRYLSEQEPEGRREIPDA